MHITESELRKIIRNVILHEETKKNSRILEEIQVLEEGMFGKTLITAALIGLGMYYGAGEILEEPYNLIRRGIEQNNPALIQRGVNDNLRRSNELTAQGAYELNQILDGTIELPEGATKEQEALVNYINMSKQQ